MPLLHGRHTCSCSRHQIDGNGFHSKLAPTHYPPDLSLEPKHIDINLSVDIAARTARGVVTTTVVANRDGVKKITLNAVDFDLVSVRDPDGGELEHNYDGKTIDIVWTTPFSRGEARKVAIGYAVEKPIAGLYFSSPSEAHPDRGTWAATDHETERARHWLPCIDHPNVRTTLNFELTSDANFTILANGQKADEEIKGDKKTITWALDFPCPAYLCCFALGDFTTFDDGEFGSIPVSYYTSTEHSADRLERSFGRTKEMLEWMTKKLGVPFPFPKYFQFALPGIGGAMENISLVSWDDIFVLDETLALEWTWLVDQINVHEMAHSYFGDAVVCRDFAHVWLKESWATYMEQCWLEDKRGADERDYDFFRNGRAYFEEADSNYKRPIVTRTFDSSWDMFDRHLYPGGAARLHTLRRELGDDAFWSGVNAYLTDNLGKVVETSDFRRALEAASGRSLVAFFDQWFHTAGYPHLEVAFAYDSEKNEGTFTVTQNQVAEDGSGVFDLNLEFGWVVDGELTVERARLRDAKNTFTFSITSDPQQVRIDPNNSVLLKLDFNPGSDKLRAQLVEATDVIGRCLAAHELAKEGGRKNVDAISAAYGAEKFWGARQQFAHALSKVPTDHAVAALATIVESEQDPMVLESLFIACQSIRDASLCDAALARLNDGRPYRAARAAWDVVGRNLNEATDDLRKAAKDRSLHALVQDGAMLGIAATRNVKEYEHLRDLRSPAQPSRVRQASCRAAGALGKFSEGTAREQIVDDLVETLRDPDVAVAWAAAQGLLAMRALEAAPKIESFCSRVPEQDRVTMKRLVTKMRDPEKEVAKQLASQLDELRKEFRKLNERVEKLEPNPEPNG